jgi:hypothetical protein
MKFLQRINEVLKNKVVYLVTQFLFLIVVIIVGLEYKNHKTKELFIFMESNRCNCKKP